MRYGEVIIEQLMENAKTWYPELLNAKNVVPVDIFRIMGILDDTIFTYQLTRNSLDQGLLYYIDPYMDDSERLYWFSYNLNRRMHIGADKWYSIGDLAQATDISYGSIHGYVTGSRWPTLLLADKICKVLKCDIRELLVDYQTYFETGIYTGYNCIFDEVR